MYLQLSAYTASHAFPGRPGALFLAARFFRAATPFAAIAFRSSSLSRASPFGTFAWPPFLPIEARYSLTGFFFATTQP